MKSSTLKTSPKESLPCDSNALTRWINEIKKASRWWMAMCSKSKSSAVAIKWRGVGDPSSSRRVFKGAPKHKQSHRSRCAESTGLRTYSRVYSSHGLNLKINWRRERVLKLSTRSWAVGAFGGCRTCWICSGAMAYHSECPQVFLMIGRAWPGKYHRSRCERSILSQS